VVRGRGAPPGKGCSRGRPVRCAPRIRAQRLPKHSSPPARLAPHPALPRPSAQRSTARLRTSAPLPRRHPTPGHPPRCERPNVNPGRQPRTSTSNVNPERQPRTSSPNVKSERQVRTSSPNVKSERQVRTSSPNLYPELQWRTSASNPNRRPPARGRTLRISGFLPFADLFVRLAGRVEARGAVFLEVPAGNPREGAAVGEAVRRTGRCYHALRPGIAPRPWRGSTR